MQKLLTNVFANNESMLAYGVFIYNAAPRATNSILNDLFSMFSHNFYIKCSYSATFIFGFRYYVITMYITIISFEDW